jgi:hypothetical protein
MNGLQQNLDLQVAMAHVSGPGTFNFGRLPSSDPMKTPLIPAEPINNYPSLAPNPFRLFIREGTDTNEVDINDIQGNKLYGPSKEFMTLVGAVARQNPNRIKNMITKNSDGSLTVTFKERISNNPVTYRNRPVHIDSGFLNGRSLKDELWPRVIAQAWFKTNNDSTQKALNQLEAITGRPTTERQIGIDSTFDQMKKDFASGKPMYIVSIERDLKYGTTENKNVAVTNVYIDEAGNKMIELKSLDEPPFLIPFDDLDKVKTKQFSYMATNYSTVVTG